MKNRVHLDLAPYPRDDQEAEAARLRALGATGIDLGQGDVPWTCLGYQVTATTVIFTAIGQPQRITAPQNSISSR